MNISEEHKEKILENFKNQFNSIFLEAAMPPGGNGFFVSTSIGRALTKFLGSRRAASVITGISLGFNAEFWYELIKGGWKRFDDWVHGQSVDIEKMAMYADDVTKHSNKATKAMIHDMSIAIEDHNWVKVAQIQRHLQAYGDRAGFKIESQKDKRKYGLHEDGGVGGGLGGAPTNNVGGGHIAGAAGDPPGPRSKLFRKVVRRKKPIIESLKRGQYSLIGYSFNPKPVRHYAAVNKKGKYLHTTSEKVARRHARSGAINEAKVNPKLLHRLTHIFHGNEVVGEIKALGNGEYEWKHTAGSVSRGVSKSYNHAHRTLIRTHLKHKANLGEGSLRHLAKTTLRKVNPFLKRGLEVRANREGRRAMDLAALSVKHTGIEDHELDSFREQLRKKSLHHHRNFNRLHKLSKGRK